MFLSLFLPLIIFHLIYTENQFYRVQPHDISALIGSNVTIPCVIATPHGDVQWTKDGLALGYDRQLAAFPSWSITGNETRGEFNFSIQSLKLDDEGIFACEVSPYQDALSLKQIAHVQVLVRPQDVKINDQTEIVDIRFDETIRQIDCQVDGARPAAHIIWTNETGQEFPATSRVVNQDRLFSTVSTLTLVPSLSLNKKRFTCNVQHITFTDHTDVLRTSFEIRIISPPDFPVIHGYTSTNRLTTGSSLTLACQSHGGHPLGSLSWYRGLDVIENSSLIVSEKNLVENNVSMIVRPEDNNQTFSCQVNNDYLQAIGRIMQRNVTLHVAFGPTAVYIRDNYQNGTTLIEDVPRQFICRTSSSNPRAMMTWKLNEQILFPDIEPIEEAGEFAGRIIQSTKTIGLDKSLRDYHRKILTCEAKNPETGLVLTDSTELNVMFDAMSIEMLGISKDQVIISDQTITAECFLTGGNPLGEIIWYKGNELLSSESTIDSNGTFISSLVNFTASISDNNLPLTCKGQVEHFPAKLASFVLNITYLPEEISIIDNSILSNLTIDDDHSRVFECRTSPSNPQVQLTVFRQGNDGEKYFDIQFKTSSSYIDGINSIQFMLPPIDPSLHENRLICEAMLDVETPPLIKEVNYVLYVNHKPYFSDFNTFFEVIENQSFNLTLLANAYPLPISYTWFHPTGRQLMNDQLNIFVDNSQLSLMNVQKDDSGDYRCLASNSLGTTEVNFTLNVLYGPVITRAQGYPLSEPVVPGTSALLSCMIDANPVDLNAVRWYKDQHAISIDQWEKRIEGKEVSIIRKSIQRDDAGEYTCEVENQFGTNRATLPLFVQYAPEIDRTDPNRNRVAVDSERFLPAEFHCHLSALPKPTVSWLKENQILPSSPKYQSILNDRSSPSPSQLLFDAILQISNITKSDYGMYQCRAENAMGTDTGELILTGLTIPDPPHEILVANLSHSSALISWSAGYDGGAPQTFQIRYRLSTANYSFYEHLPFGVQSFDLKNLRLNSTYRLNIRANNSYHLSPWSKELILKTVDTFPSLAFHFPQGVSTQISFLMIIIIGTFGLIIFLINILLLVVFVLKRRRSNVNSENISTTGTNETETNTVDLFQPIPSNFFLPNTYRKYDEEDVRKPFVSSFSSINVSQQEILPEMDHFSLYDNVRLHQYYPTNFDNHLVTYRSFKVELNHPSNIHECVRAELV